MKQKSFIPKSKTEHGGSLLLGKRRSKRPLSTKTPLHLVLRSDFAYGSRSLVKHKVLIHRILNKAARRFRIRIYQQAIVSNHIHLLVRGQRREDIQNFFRVFAGHSAQQILEQFPIRVHDRPKSGGAPRVAGSGPVREKENKFWQTRIFSRIVSWGRDYANVVKYVIRNQLEADGQIPYQPRKRNQEESDTS